MGNTHKKAASSSGGRRKVDSFSDVKGIIAKQNIFGENDTVVLKEPGSLRFGECVISDCINSTVFLCDCSSSVCVRDCSRANVVIGPCSGTVVLERLKECQIIVATQSFKFIGSSDCSVLLYTQSEPVVEDCKDLRVGCFNFFYEAMETQFEEAGLNVFCNQWTLVFDTECSMDGTFSILPKETVLDIPPLPASIRGELPPIPEYSAVPYTNPNLLEPALSEVASDVSMNAGDAFHQQQSSVANPTAMKRTSSRGYSRSSIRKYRLETLREQSGKHEQNEESNEKMDEENTSAAADADNSRNCTDNDDDDDMKREDQEEFDDVRSTNVHVDESDAKRNTHLMLSDEDADNVANHNGGGVPNVAAVGGGGDNGTDVVIVSDHGFDDAGDVKDDGRRKEAVDDEADADAEETEGSSPVGRRVVHRRMQSGVVSVARVNNIFGVESYNTGDQPKSSSDSVAFISSSRATVTSANIEDEKQEGMKGNEGVKNGKDVGASGEICEAEYDEESDRNRKDLLENTSAPDRHERSAQRSTQPLVKQARMRPGSERSIFVYFLGVPRTAVLIFVSLVNGLQDTPLFLKSTAPLSWETIEITELEFLFVAWNDFEMASALVDRLTKKLNLFTSTWISRSRITSDSLLTHLSDIHRKMKAKQKKGKSSSNKRLSAKAVAASSSIQTPSYGPLSLLPSYSPSSSHINTLKARSERSLTSSVAEVDTDSEFPPTEFSFSEVLSHAGDEGFEMIHGEESGERRYRAEEEIEMELDLELARDRRDKEIALEIRRQQDEIEFLEEQEKRKQIFEMERKAEEILGNVDHQLSSGLLRTFAEMDIDEGIARPESFASDDSEPVVSEGTQ